MDLDAWRTRLLEERRAKDAFCRTDPDSPLPAEARAGFPGLAYFPPDPRLRFELPLLPAPPRRLRIPRTGGDEASYVRVGTFTVRLADSAATLAAYEGDGYAHGELFVPFRDATSAKETYGAGRYLEALPLRGGRYRLDFNRAYHPYCAYDDRFTCPLPPQENWLSQPVRAGERLDPASAG